MGFLSGLFGGGAAKAGHETMRNSMFSPYNISGPFGSITSTPGYTPTQKEWKRGMRPTSGTFSAALSPEQQMFRDVLSQLFMGQAGQLGQSAGGFLGITPEMFAEFERSNMNDLSPDFINASRGYLSEEQGMGPYNFDDIYSKQLGLMRDLDLPAEQRTAQSALDTLFGKGILASDAGRYQTEALGNVLSQRDVMRQLGASDVALARGDQYNQIRQMLQQASLGFGGAGSGLIRDRFNRAMELFGAGQEAEHLGSQRTMGYLGGLGAQDQFLANLMQLSGNLGAQRSGANLGAGQVYTQAKMAQDQMFADLVGGILGGMSFGGPSGFGFNLPGSG